MTQISFRALADELAAEIAIGRLRPGDRLEPQRDFAYRRGIAASTAARVYAELRRRGLTGGEVGRGTYVRSGFERLDPALAEPPSAAVDLELNFPILPEQGELLARSLAGLLQADAFGQALRPVGARATDRARVAVAAFLSRSGWYPEPDGILFAGNGRQAIAAVLSALARPGDRIGVEALTYPVVRAIAARLGLTLVPIACDQQGLCPDALEAAHRAAPLRAVYLQPVLHNPLGLGMGPERRAALAALLARTGLVAVEDAIYAFLADEPPLAALAPAQTVVVDSLSKRLAPGLTLGLVAAPPALVDGIAAAVRSNA
jgi:DNA-binding transcriptional MocR family regulator